MVGSLRQNQCRPQEQSSGFAEAMPEDLADGYVSER